MREYLNKKRLITARKSGTYSRLLQRYRRKWNSSRNEVKGGNPENVVQQSKEAPQFDNIPENEISGICDEFPTICDDFSVIYKESSSENIRKNILIKCASLDSNTVIFSW